MNKEDLLNKIHGGLIVSCQAEGDEPLNSAPILTALSLAAIRGGAVAIRAERPGNIIEMKKHVHVPLIGLFKQKHDNSDVYITPTLKEALAIIDAGADILALDATSRPRPNQENLITIVNEVKQRSAVLLMADVATLEEGLNAAEMGFDLIGTTLSGYTATTAAKAASDQPDFELITALVARLGHRIPIIAEGRIWTAEDAYEALRRGAFAVVIGTAITRPTIVTRKIVAQIEKFRQLQDSIAVGVDLGGTKTAIGLVSFQGAVKTKKIISSNWDGGTKQVIGDLISGINRIIGSGDKPIAAIGIAASGRVNPEHGVVFDGVPLANDYFGYPIQEQISNATGLPVSIENDANAAAYAEYSIRKDRPPQRLVFVTIGTGIGGGIMIDGKLLRGTGNAGEIGHICIEHNGRKCRCGRRGCLETYVSRKLLEQEIQNQLPKIGIASLALTTDTIIELIRSNHPQVMKIFYRQMDYLASGLETIFNMIEPDLVVLGGELSRLENILIDSLQKRILRPIPMTPSKLGNTAGMIGAALLAIENLH